jgi:hypothetical protein
MPPPTPHQPDWFREPTPREHKIAAALFLGFGLFFFALSFVWRGVWFGWVIAALGIWSLIVAHRHWRDRHLSKTE